MDVTMVKRMFGLVEFIMRIPPLFVIDELLKMRLGPVEEMAILNGTEVCRALDFRDLASQTYTCANPDLTRYVTLDVYLYEMYFLTAFKFMVCCIGCLTCLCIFVLSTTHLEKVYMYLIPIGLTFLSYWSNVSTIKAIIGLYETYGSWENMFKDARSLDIVTWVASDTGFLLVRTVLVQIWFSVLFNIMYLGPKSELLGFSVCLSFSAPSYLSLPLAPVIYRFSEPSVLYHAPVLGTLVPLAASQLVLWHNGSAIWTTVHAGYKHARNFINNYGLTALAETEWSRLNVPNVLRTFWVLRVGEQVVELLSSHYNEENFTYYTLIRTLLINGCETLTALLGMTSIISSICYYIGCFSQWALMTGDGDDRSIGTISAVLFYILALQNGLTSLEREKRLVRLCRNLCLLFTAILHFVHNIVNPLLMSLSASHNPSLNRHFRALAVCAILIICPVSLLVFLWSHFTISTWLFAVSIFSIEVIVKVLVSLAIYSLFLFDAYRSVFWEQLDDCVYIIRSFGNAIEFSFGIVLFFNGFWILVSESGGTVRAIMICIHAYFNIWCEANAGWNVFMKRRTAVDKINSLPEARVEQLRILNDVCAICYQEMQTAKVTSCNHYFHGICLRKWLYIQDRCPLCHDILYKVPENQAAWNCDVPAVIAPPYDPET